MEDSRYMVYLFCLKVNRQERGKKETKNGSKKAPGSLRKVNYPVCLEAMEGLDNGTALSNMHFRKIMAPISNSSL